MLASTIKEKNLVFKAESHTLKMTYSTASFHIKEQTNNTLAINADCNSTHLHCKNANTEKKRPICLVEGGYKHGYFGAKEQYR